MKLHELVVQLGNELGIQNAKLNEQKVCNLTIGENLVITIEEDETGDAAYLSSRLCFIPQMEEQRIALFDVLMEAHSFGLATGDAYFSATPATGRVIITRRFDLETITWQKFKEGIEAFARVVQYWLEAINSGLIYNEKSVASNQDGSQAEAWVQI